MRTHIVLPEELVEEVDALVGARRRSRFFAEAVAEKVARLKLLRAAEAAMGSLVDVDVPAWESSASAAEWVHDLRRADSGRLEHLREAAGGS